MVVVVDHRMEEIAKVGFTDITMHSIFIEDIFAINRQCINISTYNLSVKITTVESMYPPTKLSLVIVSLRSSQSN